MRKPKTAVLIMATLAATLMSCKNNKTDTAETINGDNHQMEMGNEMNNEMHEKMMNNGNQNQATAVINEYLELKNALVADNTEKAAKVGGDLKNAIESFDQSSIAEAQEQEVADILEDAKMHAEHILENKGNMVHQREHFQILSVDIKDLLAILGTDRTLYQAYCPMYNNGDGGIWLSAVEEIKNPYFGSKMLKCGKVQEVIQ
ncbi:MAG TPA: DUF3347 domain-containing protein [Flavobacteriaceae bacterium]|nr:DUF3347 domain-containing protein [Flavobacteriaceae bacterium]